MASWPVTTFLMLAGLPLGSALGHDQDRETPNFRQVNIQVYRGGQPSEDGLKRLAQMGVKTILDLREGRARARREEQTASSLGMRYVNIAMKSMRVPSNDQIERALAALEDHSGGPIFLHCKRGADRTGMVIACYRISHDGWVKKKALAEARQCGMSWYQLPLQYYVLRYRPAAKPPVDVSAAGSAGAQQLN